MRRNRRKYIYSNKKHTERGIFSTILAVLSFATLVLSVVLSYKNSGDIPANFGAAAFLCTIFSGAGIIIGIWGKSQEDRFYLYSYIGIIWNIVDLLLISGILYAGI